MAVLLLRFRSSKRGYNGGTSVAVPIMQRYYNGGTSVAVSIKQAML